MTTPITNKDQANNSTDFYINYSESGEYEISIDGWYNHFRCYDDRFENPDITQMHNVLIEIIQVSNLITNFYRTFSHCSNLTSIPSGLFDKNTSVINFSGTFENCINLKTIPSGLFDKNTDVTTFSGIFYYCSNLTSIPSGLFNKNTDVINFTGTFEQCSSLKNIPIGLFDKNISVINFAGTFSNCSSLASIPSGLFDKNTVVRDFSGVFENCFNLTGETPYTLSSDRVTKIRLWDRDGTNGFVKPIGTKKAFNNCIQLTNYTNIPSDWK